MNDRMLSSRDLLLMAAAVHGLGPATDLSFANTARVMRQALHWAGLLRGKVEERFESYEECPPLSEYYDTLISMMPQAHPPEVLFECGGNWGGPDAPRASAHFTSCRLTPRGWVVAQELLEEHPGYRHDIHVRDGRYPGPPTE